MDFKSALTKVCHDFSKEIIFQRRIISILDDYGAFKDVPYYKLFYKTIFNIGDMAQLISQNPNERAQTIYSFLAFSGLDEIKVKSFLTLISECYYGVTSNPLQSNDAGKAPQNESSITEIQHEDIQVPQISHSDKVTFLGIPLGDSYFAFENVLYSRNCYIKNRKGNDVTFAYENFLFAKKALVTLSKLQNSKIVSKIRVELITEITHKDLELSFWSDVVNLFKAKYGNPASNIYSSNKPIKWIFDSDEISLFLEDGKVVIIYVLISNDVQAYERAMQLKIEQRQKEIERQKAEMEAKRKQEEMEAQRKEQQRYFKDI